MTRRIVTSIPCTQVFVRARRAREWRECATRGVRRRDSEGGAVDEVDRIGTDVHGQGDETRAERGDGGGPGR